MGERERIGFIGAGMMGRGMAKNLLKAGYAVTLFIHRRRDGVEPLLAAGAGATRELGELAGQSDAIIVCVDNAHSVRGVIDGLLPALRAGQLLIDATTSDPEVTREIAATLRARGVVYADCPVTGGPVQAEAGALGSIVGCAERDFARVQAIVSHYSKTVQRIGEVGTGHTAKLLNNFVTQGTAVLLAEAYGRAREAGVDWRALYAVMEAGAARSGTLEKMVKPALEGNFDGTQFSIRNAHKDVGYFRRLAEKSARGPSEMAAGIHRVLEEALNAGLGERYVSILLRPDENAGQNELS